MAANHFLLFFFQSVPWLVFRAIPLLSWGVCFPLTSLLHFTYISYVWLSGKTHRSIGSSNGTMLPFPFTLARKQWPLGRAHSCTHVCNCCRAAAAAVWTITSFFSYCWPQRGVPHGFTIFSSARRNLISSATRVRTVFACLLLHLTRSQERQVCNGEYEKCYKY